MRIQPWVARYRGRMNPPDYKQFTQHLPEPALVPLPGYSRYAEPEMRSRAEKFYGDMSRRRTTRHFSSESVPRRLIELALLTAGTAPSGAHRQPWRFVAIDDPVLKSRMRAAAEEEELKTYSGRMTEEWREALHPLGTDHVKAHMTDAPCWWCCSRRNMACANTVRTSRITTSMKAWASPRACSLQPFK